MLIASSIIIVNNRARILLEEKDDDMTFETDKMSRRWYRACLNETEIEKKGVHPLLNSLNKLGGWPVLEDTERDYKSFKWFEQVRLLNIEGFSIKTIMKYDIETDDKNSSYRVFRLDQPRLGLDREYLIDGFNDKYVQFYYQYMVNSAVLLGANKSRAEKELKESLLFEIALANISAPKEERRDPNKLYNPVTLGELDGDKYIVNGIGQPPSWVDHISGILNDAISFKYERNQEGGVRNIVINSDEKIIIRNPQYFINVLKLINQTDPKTVANYMAWRVVKSRMKYLNKEASNIKQQYDKSKTGKAEKKAAWKRCVKSTGFNQYSFHKGAGAASSMYVRRYFKPEEKEVMLEMIRYIRGNFKKLLQNVSWMDNETKIEAEKKLNNMGQIIAYPDELIDRILMTEMHKGINLPLQTRIIGYYYILEFTLNRL